MIKKIIFYPIVAALIMYAIFVFGFIEVSPRVATKVGSGVATITGVIKSLGEKLVSFSDGGVIDGANIVAKNSANNSNEIKTQVNKQIPKEIVSKITTAVDEAKSAMGKAEVAADNVGVAAKEAKEAMDEVRVAMRDAEVIADKGAKNVVTTGENVLDSADGILANTKQKSGEMLTGVKNFSSRQLEKASEWGSSIKKWFINMKKKVTKEKSTSENSEESTSNTSNASNKEAALKESNIDFSSSNFDFDAESHEAGGVIKLNPN